ncbi:formylglycine-generating enzyme family protein [Aestuariivirga litoralis]|uniref:formylglycine-generating enzyme family protein n=1 Tax=Aestuariivirga litoralis TaxID=2650924 RepID=UPI0013795A2A|nr:SUMF1/EgtB/PvdO family nonheme iron enzyme [Aestuariivirga litoralis]
MNIRHILSGIAILAASHGVAAADPLAFDMVSVGDAANSADPATGFGRVARAFAISKHDVTIADYVAFLNAVAKDDPHQLYNPLMASDLMVAGIRREGAAGSYVYTAMEPAGAVQSAAATAGGRPVTYVSWFDAARFANWMANGQPTGPQSPRTTENGAYDLTGRKAAAGIAVRRNAVNPNTRRKPSHYIPTENEWYKAAYYNPTLNEGVGGYTLYATASSSTPGNSAGSSPNQANYVAGGGLFAMTQTLSLDPAQNYLTDVGAFTATPGPYGTYDMNGSVWELTDMDARPGVVRTIRGGGWTSYYSYLQSDYRLGNATTAASSNVGFRLAASGSHASSIDYALSRIGNPGNRRDSTGFGAVGRTFWIGTYEVTIGQYCDFLNAVARSDPHGLYDQAMSLVTNSAGIERLGSDGSYSYAPLDNAGDSANRPVTYVNWFDVARFANWMANGQPTGAQGPATTEDGAYRLLGATGGAAVARNRVNPNRGGAPSFWLPTENEWYKAAYYDPRRNGNKGGYYRYATASDTAPGNQVGAAPNMANYIDDYNGTYFYAVPQARYIDLGQNYLFDVGAYSASPSHYGTFDQSGAVYNWNDLDGSASASRGLRGGFFFAGAASIQSVTFAQVSPLREGADAGFRLASPQ